MKSLSLNKIYLISFLIGCMVTLALFALGANANTNSNSLNFSLNLFVYAGEDVTIRDNDNYQTYENRCYRNPLSAHCHDLNKKSNPTLNFKFNNSWTIDHKFLLVYDEFRSVVICQWHNPPACKKDCVYTTRLTKRTALSYR